MVKFLKLFRDCLKTSKVSEDIEKYCDVWVIPCQINKEFRVISRILTKLGMFVVPVVLITHANF